MPVIANFIENNNDLMDIEEEFEVLSKFHAGMLQKYNIQPHAAQNFPRRPYENVALSAVATAMLVATFCW